VVRDATYRQVREAILPVAYVPHFYGVVFTLFAMFYSIRLIERDAAGESQA